MDELKAQYVADTWSGGSGLVPRGPKLVLAARPSTPAEVERRTGRRPVGAVWRLEVGGRFLRSGGIVYPGGVPFPEELHSRTAVIANEVWLYVDEDGHVLGVYWWPDAVRRPVASVPREDFAPELVVHPSDAGSRLSFLRLPDAPPWEPVAAVCISDREAVVFLTRGEVPDPLNEMVVYEHGGLSLRASCEDEPGRRVDDFAGSHSPPYRRLRAPGAYAVGRDPGRALGPQTWPWPGELRWWEDGVAYELKGFVPIQTLQEVAATQAGAGG